MRKRYKINYKIIKRNLIILSTILVLILIIKLILVIPKLKNEASENKKITICLDPGHGGPSQSDRGNITPNGFSEAELNEKVALEVQKNLEKLGFNVIFTKDPSYKVLKPLDDRAKVANEANADLFISIHHDGNEDRESEGIWMFYSSYKVNLDNEGIIVIYDGEEYALVKEKNEDNDYGITHTVKLITDGEKNIEINSTDDTYKVIDTTPCKEAIESKIFAELMYETCSELTNIKVRGSKDFSVRDEEYRVLRYANMPSALIECGFMSNTFDAIEMEKDENIKAVADKIADAVVKYFK